MKIAFQSLTFLLSCIDQTRARTPQLVQPGSQLSLQTAVLDGDSGSRRCCSEQLRLILQRRVVQQRGHGLSVPVDQRRHAAAAQIGEVERPAVDVCVGVELGQPVREIE